MVSNVRGLSLPETTTLDPLVREAATFSAISRHAEARSKRMSPSFHSLEARSNVRGVEATVKFATGLP